MTDETRENNDDLIEEWFSVLKGIFLQSERFAKLGQGEGKALFLLSRSPEGLSSGALSAEMDLSTGRMANILHQLEAKGLITRAQNPANKRMTIIKLTDAGIQHISDTIAEAKNKASDVLHRLGREDTQTLIRIFKKLGDNEDARLPSHTHEGM